MRQSTHKIIASKIHITSQTKQKSKTKCCLSDTFSYFVWKVSGNFSSFTITKFHQPNYRHRTQPKQGNNSSKNFIMNLLVGWLLACLLAYLMKTKFCSWLDVIWLEYVVDKVMIETNKKFHFAKISSLW